MNTQDRLAEADWQSVDGGVSPERKGNTQLWITTIGQIRPKNQGHSDTTVGTRK